MHKERRVRSYVRKKVKICGRRKGDGPGRWMNRVEEVVRKEDP